MELNFWKNEVADMPTRDKDGKWYDLETGIYFSDCVQKKKNNISDECKTARQYAKKFGGKSLTGTFKQKEWAEKIRYNFIKSLPEDEIVKIQLYSFDLFQSSKFWIHNRSKTVFQIIIAMFEITKLIEIANELLIKAQSEIKTDSKNIIISKGDFHKYHAKRNEILNQVNKNLGFDYFFSSF